jgi:hypothetical protein
MNGTNEWMNGQKATQEKRKVDKKPHKKKSTYDIQVDSSQRTAICNVESTRSLDHGS